MQDKFVNMVQENEHLHAELAKAREEIRRLHSKADLYAMIKQVDFLKRENEALIKRNNQLEGQL